MYLRLIFLIALAVTVNSCQMENSILPLAKFTATNVGCTVPCQVNFLDASENTGVYQWNYTWKFVDSTSHFSTVQNPVFSFKKAGTYKILLTISNPKYGESTSESVVTVVAPASADFSYQLDSLSSRDMIKATFINQSVDTKSYHWQFGDGQISTDKSPIHEYTRLEKDTLYTITLTSTPNVGEAKVKEKNINITRKKK